MCQKGQIQSRNSFITNLVIQTLTSLIYKVVIYKVKLFNESFIVTFIYVEEN